MTSNLNLAKLIIVASAIGLGYFLLIGLLFYYSVGVPGVIGEVFRAIRELVTIPLLVFVPVGLLFCLYHIILKKSDKKAYVVAGLLNLATILWMVFMSYYFD